MDKSSNQRRNLLRLNIHLVWGTKNRLPLIRSDDERRLFRNMVAILEEYGATVLAINGMPDHVHILVSLSPKYALSDVIKNVKGSSSRFFSETLRPGEWFQWQPNYAAINVSPGDVEGIKAYILNQKQHHGTNNLWPEFEQIDQPYEPENDEKSATHTMGATNTMGATE